MNIFEALSKRRKTDTDRDKEKSHAPMGPLTQAEVEQNIKNQINKKQAQKTSATS